MTKKTIKTTIDMTEEEAERKEVLKKKGWTIIKIWRLGLKKAWDKDGGK